MMKKTVLALLLAMSAFAVRVYGQTNSMMSYGRPFFTNYSAVEYGAHNRNFDVVCDSTGKVYVANFEGLVIWNGLEWKTIHTPGISRITDVFISPQGQLWFGGYNVLGTLDAADGVSYVISDTARNVSIGEISDLNADSDGNITFLTQNGGYRVVEGTVKPFDGASSASLTDQDHNGMAVNMRLAIPDMGISVLATESDGLLVLDTAGNTVISLGSDDGLCSNSITRVAYDGHGSVWGVTDNGMFKVCILSPFSQFGAVEGLVGQVTSIISACDTLFVGTLQGLFRQDSTGLFTKIPGIDLACWDLELDDSGNLIAATAQGVFQIMPQVEQKTVAHTLSVMPFGEGFISAELDGIYRYDGNAGAVCLNPIQNVCKLERNSDGDILAINYARETYRMASGADSFQAVVTDSITLLFRYTDPDGRTWSCGPDGKGLECDGLTDTQSEWCRPLDQYTIESMLVSGGEAFVGGSFGLIRMDMQFIGSMGTMKPSIRMRSFAQDGANVEFSFATDKQDPIGKTQYSYRMQSDGRWSKWSDEQKINFDHLSSGKYELTVRCIDAYGNIAETEPVQFIVEPPFFLRWYASVAYVMLLGGIIFGFFRLRLYKARQEQLRLEEIVNERTIQLKEAQNQLLRQEREATVGKLTKGLIDRILNPMNYINNFSHLTIGLTKDLTENLEDDKEHMTPDIYDDSLDVVDMMKTNLDKIEQHGLATTRILKAMEELLKDHSGELEPTDMVALCEKDIEMLENYSKNDIEALGISIRTDMPETAVMASVNQVNMSKAVMSMLSNSVYALKKKFEKMPAGTERPEILLTVKTGESGQGCNVLIHDNGIGIEQSILDKIFDPFFTTKPTSEAPGVGLYLSQQIVQDAGGNILVDSKKDEFTTFTIVLP